MLILVYLRGDIMINIYYTDSDNGNTKLVKDYIKGSWINMISPSEEEIKEVCDNLNIKDDFIKYSLEDKSIRNFIKELNNTDDGIKIKITGKIEPLHHQDYDGKRVYITLTDKNHYSISSKLDIGVHKYFDIKQDEYYFDFNIIEESVSLLINSKEQIMVEKLKSLLKFGITSTRFKDIFDFYYLINNEVLNKDKLIKYIDILIFQDKNMRENTLKDIHIRLTNILNNHRFQSRINTANNNWLEIPIKDVTDSVLDYFDGLVTIKR